MGCRRLLKKVKNTIATTIVGWLMDEIMKNQAFNMSLAQSQEARVGTESVIAPLDGVAAPSFTLAFQKTINSRFEAQGKPWPYPEAGLE